QPIILADGKPLIVPTCYVGAARIRLLPPENVNLQAQPGEILLVFEVTAEPRLQVFRPMGEPIITRAFDDQAQNLTPMEQKPGADPGNPRALRWQALGGNPMSGAPMQRLIPVRLKVGDKKAQFLKDLAGNFSVEVQAPSEPVAMIDNVLHAKGQTAKG